MTTSTKAQQQNKSGNNDEKIARLLEIRKEKKAKKPVFAYQDSWKIKRLATNAWRKPRGGQSKMRTKFKGNLKMPSQGFRSPRAVRGLHGSGLPSVVVSSVKQLESVPATVPAIIIASTVGMKNKLAIMKAAAARKLTVLNQNAATFVQSAEAKLAERKKARSARSSDVAAAKPADKSGKSDEKKEGQTATTEEEKRKADKQEMEDLITKRV